MISTWNSTAKPAATVNAPEAAGSREPHRRHRVNALTRLLRSRSGPGGRHYAAGVGEVGDGRKDTSGHLWPGSRGTWPRDATDGPKPPETLASREEFRYSRTQAYRRAGPEPSGRPGDIPGDGKRFRSVLLIHSAYPERWRVDQFKPGVINWTRLREVVRDAFCSWTANASRLQRV